MFQGIPDYVKRIDAAYERKTDGAIVLFHGIWNIYWSIFASIWTLLNCIFNLQQKLLQVKNIGYLMAIVS